MRAENTPRPDGAPPKRSTDEIVRDRKAHLIDLVGRRLKENLTWETLGPMAQAFLDAVAGPKMKKSLEGEARAVPAGLAQRMADDLQDLVVKDRFLLAPPADAKDRPSVLDDRRIQVIQNKGASTHRMAGLELGQHVLGDVFKAFDIPADGFAGTVADVIKTGVERRADLANPKTWLSLVPEMAAAAMATKGPWQARVGAAALAGVNRWASMPPTIDVPAESVPTSGTGSTASRDEVERSPDRRPAQLLGDTSPHAEAPSGERKPGTMAGGVLGMAQARVQSGDNRRLANQTRELFKALKEVLGDDGGALDELAREFSAAASKGVGHQPRLIDLSRVPTVDPVVWPTVDPKVEDFAHQVLGPEGLNVQVVGGNEMAAANFMTVLGMATKKAESEMGRPVDLEDPQDQAAVLRVAIDNLVDVSPTAKALSAAFDALASTLDPEQAGVLQTQLGRHERKIATTWVVEALTSRAPEALATAQAEVSQALRAVDQALEAFEEPPPELANAKTGLTAQRQALTDPDGSLAQAVLRGGLAELQFPTSSAGGPDVVTWAQQARRSYEKAAGDARMKLETGTAAQAVAPNAAPALGRSSLATIWNVAAEAAGGVPPWGPSGPNQGGSGGGGSGGPGRPGGPGGPGGPPRRPGDFGSFETADNYAASMGARVDKRNAHDGRRDNFDDIRAILNDPALEFFDKIFLVMTMLIDRMRNKIEKDQIDQLDREEMMWINEQLAHEYQKEVEMAQRDIHELGKEVDKSASAFSKAERHLKQLEATPEEERAPDHDKQVADAKNLFEQAKGSWTDNMGRFEQRKTVLNELRDARDAHRVQIASDRRSADIFAAKVKRNTHVVEMYMDLIKTFEEHKKRNLARMLSS